MEATKDIGEIQSQLTQFNLVEAGIAELQSKYAGAVFDVKTTKGMDEAKSARAAIREPRYRVEEIRKAAKAPVLKIGKEIDAAAKAVTKKLVALEDPIDAQIKVEEKRKEDEKQARIKAEEMRVAAINAKLDEIRNLPAKLITASSEDMKAAHKALTTRHLTMEEFAEMVERAEAVRAESAQILATMYDTKVAAERAAAEAKAREDERKAEQARAAAAEEENRKLREQLAAAEAKAVEASKPKASSEPVAEAVIESAGEPAAVPDEVEQEDRPTLDEMIDTLAFTYDTTHERVRGWLIEDLK